MPLSRTLPLALAAALLAALLLFPTAQAGAWRHEYQHARHHHVIGACSASHAPVQRTTIREARFATVCLLNRVRGRHGLAPLHLNPRLSRAARLHSRDMVRRRYFAHDSLNGTSPFSRMRETHYVPRNASWWLGENIGWGSGTLAQPIALVRAWMHSPPHRENILSRHFRDIGVGIALGAPVGGGGATYTTDFGRHT